MSAMLCSLGQVDDDSNTIAADHRRSIARPDDKTITFVEPGPGYRCFKPHMNRLPVTPARERND
jgi:hypothetical protein